MASSQWSPGVGARGEEGESADEDPQVLAFMTAGRDRDLLVDVLSGSYSVETTTDPAALEGGFDCCIIDRDQFARNADALRTGKEVSPPFVLLVSPGDSADNPNVWEYVDDVIDLPVPREALVARVSNLVDKHRTARELERRTRRLEQTVADLELKERAIDESPVGLVVTDPHQPDNPMVYVNKHFEEMTGYDGSEVIGRNCRFLQGEETDPETVATLREAVDAGEHASVDILNYRADGSKFWNELEIAPVRDEEGQLRHFVGFQRDITERKIRERRLEVLNRVLSHNLKNKMNVIEGHAALLNEVTGEGEASLAEIGNAAADLEGLADSVREIERTVSTPGGTVSPIALDEHLRASLSAFEDRYPDAEFELVVEGEGPHEVAVPGLLTAVETAIENAVEHNPGDSPTVEVRVGRPSADWLAVEVADDGPGIPAHEVEVLGSGETSLTHADRLGLWLMYWVVSKAGGDLSLAENDPTGTVVTLSVPLRH